MGIDANDLMQALAAQRNAALDEAARLSAHVQMLHRENVALTSQLDALKNPPDDAPS